MKLRKLVQEQHAIVRETDFAWGRLAGSTQQSRIRDGVMRTPKGPARDKPMLAIEQSTNAVHLGCFDRFPQSKRR
jgi:hypothetical protein